MVLQGPKLLAFEIMSRSVPGPGDKFLDLSGSEIWTH